LFVLFSTHSGHAVSGFYSTSEATYQPLSVPTSFGVTTIR